MIDYATGQGAAESVRTLLSRGGLRTTVITRFELLSGAKNSKQLAKIMDLMEAIPALPLDVESTDKAGEIRRQLEKAGNAIGMADSLIAGIVVSQGGSLFTRNLRHFERVPGLSLYDSK